MNTTTSRSAMIGPIELTNVIDHPFIQHFISYPEHARLIRSYRSEPTEANLDQVNHAFQVYLFAVRFTKYLGSLIHNGRIDYVRKMKRHEEREQVIYDKPVSEEEESAIGEMLTKVYYGDDLPQVTVDPKKFQEQLNNEWLYDGFSRLTSRQKYVITLAYSAMNRDSEIAALLNVSQQAIFKTRAGALRNMRKAFPSHSFPLRLRG
ncbi:hypothetical protein PCCS19_05260 [Paenibacillus sp. CCS19]|uniref:hypothetical protein n=1 Tax=Paenibacillus sp. CCS19 TaxID=3158387 RepID=UPI0025634883|nr:hypothetical protein [Paenibacillus cellulosilyticus]GMK37472.1 hypothetical protein PCCS19_05260 [Paenibacillus cellulosilyticus]